jgi:hypothetical protein
LKVVSKLVQKDRKDLSPGEVFWMRSNAGDILCLYVRPLEDGRHVWLNLSAAVTEGKCEMYTSELIGTCLSYGTETILEFVDTDSTRPARFRETSSAGIDGINRVLRCEAKGQFYTDVMINLDRLAEHHEGGDVYPVDTWRIWASGADMTDPRAKPIFAVGPIRLAD